LHSTVPVEPPTEKHKGYDMTEPPLFSVVIPSYNSAPTLAVALGGVLRQRFEDFEVVIVDDGSTDATSDFLATVRDPRVRLIRQEHRGESVARNLGIAQSRGKFVVFLDSDDQVFEPWLRAFALMTLEYREASILRCGGILMGPGGVVRTVSLPGSDRSIATWLPGFLGGMYAVRKDLLEEVGGIANELTFGQHSELGMRLWPTVRQGNAAATTVIGLRKTWSGGDDRYALARTESTKYVLAHHGELLRRERRFRAACLATAGVSAARVGAMGEARTAFVRSLMAWPWSGKALARLILSAAGSLTSSFWAGRAPALEVDLTPAGMGIVAPPVQDRFPTLVSVAIPGPLAYARLARQWDALVHQSFRGDWEIVVADDGSGEVLRVPTEGGYGHRLTVRRVEVGHQASLSHSRNLLVAASQGELVAICEEDEPVAPGWLEDLVAVSANADIVVSAATTHCAGESGVRAQGPMSHPARSKSRRRGDDRRASTGTMGVWRSAWESLGGWKESTMPTSEGEFRLRAELAGYAWRGCAVGASRSDGELSGSR
jgi:glycosyltransferase involved in cell wall biosynthesis